MPSKYERLKNEVKNLEREQNNLLNEFERIVYEHLGYDIPNDDNQLYKLPFAYMENKWGNKVYVWWKQRTENIPEKKREMFFSKLDSISERYIEIRNALPLLEKKLNSAHFWHDLRVWWVSATIVVASILAILMLIGLSVG